jgi:hypothetical protein
MCANQTQEQRDGPGDFSAETDLFDSYGGGSGVVDDKGARENMPSKYANGNIGNRATLQQRPPRSDSVGN